MIYINLALLLFAIFLFYEKMLLFFKTSKNKHLSVYWVWYSNFIDEKD